jgi:hypothetical protein
MTNEEFDQITERIRIYKEELEIRKETEELKRFGHLSMKTYFR